MVIYFSRPVCLPKCYWGAENVPEKIISNFGGTVLVGLYQLYEGSCKTKWSCTSLTKAPWTMCQCFKHASLPCCHWLLLSAVPQMQDFSVAHSTPGLGVVSVGIRCEGLDCRRHVLCELFWVTASVTYQNWNDTFSFWSTSFFRLTYSQSNFLIELQSSLSKELETVALWDSLIQTLELLHGQYMLSAKSWNNVSKELHCPGKVALSCPNF